MDADRERWMRRCLELAARPAGRVSPNPRVGAVVVGASGRTIGEGCHEAFGAPHAEFNAIHNARRHGRKVLREATLFVNLEPCNHVGKTPPCTDLILESGIPCVMIGMPDPNPKAAGGADRLRSRGLRVETGILEAECRRLNEAFVRHLRTGCPLVTLKIAQSADGFVAAEGGRPVWITGQESRVLVHRWRAESDGILVGSATARADDPSLTVRHVAGANPRRFVLDRTGDLPPGLKLFTDEFRSLTAAIVSKAAKPAYERHLTSGGGAVLRMETATDGHLDLAAVLDCLGGAHPPVQSLLVEAGPRLSSALLKRDLVDRLFVFHAPTRLGSGIRGLTHMQLSEAVPFAERSLERVGEDRLFRGFRHKA